MQMKITYRELAEMSGSLNNLVQVQMPAKYAFRFSKVAKMLQEELQTLNSQKEELIKKYGEENQTEQGVTIQVKASEAENFYNEWNGVLAEQITFNFEPIPISSFEDSTVTVADMALLEKFFLDDISDTSTEEPATEAQETEAATA